MRRWLLFGCTNVALIASAQQSSSLQPGDGNFQNDPWRLERISPDNDWTRHFRLGMVTGLNIKDEFKMSGGNFGINGNSGENYDDGYVRTDDTGNAPNPNDGRSMTSYWGYQNPSQYVGNTLTMHRATSFSASGSSGGGADSPNVGLDLAYGDSYWYWGHAKLGWELGFDFLPIHLANSSTMSGTVSSTAYTFEVPANGLNGPFQMPGAPYNGPASGIGPLIYYDSTGSSSSGSVPGTITGTHTLDTMLYAMRLGPSLYWDIGQKFGVYATAGPAIGLTSGNFEYDETITYNPGSGTITAHNHGEINGTSLIYGGYVNATFVYHVVEGGDFYLGGQFMPMSSATFSSGGRSGKLDLSGQVYITAGINWPF